MRTRFASFALAASILLGTVSVAVMPGCATVAGDPVGTNAARYVQTGSVYRATLVGWAAVLERDVHREKPLLTPETYAHVKQIRLSIDTLMDQWSRSVAAGEPFSEIDSLFALLDELARITTEYNR